MITQIAQPYELPEKWRNFIQHSHMQEFGTPICHSVDDYWWFVDYQGQDVAGFAGARPEMTSSLYLGPCVVFEKFRGMGLQRRFIRRRERLARLEKFSSVLSVTHHKNYASVNNFIRCGYLVCPPWTDAHNDSNKFIYWRKTL